ncbi:TetR/AcrR family transcriptional regulator [Gordonia sp. DT30]|uniref:TetR/AcrR family transcriptional regulator n=1 Tax=Gordonia sp. DT30 TaxID=3416546 RepID=UPI003CFBAB69
MEPVPIPKSTALLWGRVPDAPRRGPKPTLTIHDIARAAVDIADQRGWEAVSMKAIAQSVGLTAMSLYRYVDSKDDIIDILVDEAYGAADPQLGTTGTWREQITEWARTAAGTLRRRPWLTEIPMSRPPTGPNVMSWTEAGVRAFDTTGLSGPQKMNALLLVDGFVRQHIRQSAQMGLLQGGTTTDASPGPGYEATVASLIDPDRFPALTSAMRSMVDDDGDFDREQFDFGLTIILDGLAGMIESD